MIKIYIISFFLVSSVLLVALSDWFVVEGKKVDAITQEHLNDIRRLKKIAKINKWMDEVVKPSLERLKDDVESTDNDLVNFFDAYSEEFNFKVSKYIYADLHTQNLDIGFEVQRDSIDKLKDLTLLKHKTGFLHFNTFRVDTTSLKGELKVIQPYYGDRNAS